METVSKYQEEKLLFHFALSIFTGGKPKINFTEVNSQNWLKLILKGLLEAQLIPSY